MLQDYTMSIKKSIFISAWLFQMLEKESYVINIMLIYFLKHNYDNWFEKEELDDTTSSKIYKEESGDLSDMAPLEGDEKEGKGLKILTPSKLLTKLPILLAQIKAGNNSNKLKKEIRQILFFCISIIKSLKRFTRENIIMEENMLMIRDPKSLFFNFDWPKNVDENLNGEIKFIIKINELLVGNKIKNEIEQLLFKYKHGNSIHEHRKQQIK